MYAELRWALDAVNVSTRGRVDRGGCWTPTLDQIAMKRLFGRWFSGSSGVLGTVKSERKGGKSTCEIFGEEGSKYAITAQGTC